MMVNRAEGPAIQNVLEQKRAHAQPHTLEKPAVVGGLFFPAECLEEIFDDSPFPLPFPESHGRNLTRTHERTTGTAPQTTLRIDRNPLFG
jgi:hypothetical protein